MGRSVQGRDEQGWQRQPEYHGLHVALSMSVHCPIFHLCYENFIVILRTSLTGLIVILKYSLINIFLSVSCMFCRPLVFLPLTAWLALIRFHHINLPAENLLNLFKTMLFHSPYTVLESARIFHGCVCLYSWLKSSSITLVPSLRNIWLHGDPKFGIVEFN